MNPDEWEEFVMEAPPATLDELLQHIRPFTRTSEEHPASLDCEGCRWELGEIEATIKCWREHGTLMPPGRIGYRRVRNADKD